MIRWRFLGGALVLGLLAGSQLPGLALAANGLYPVGTAARGYYEEVVAPTSSPPGVNVAGCRPSAAHPYPVILLPGTFYDLAESFQALGPALANAGYCVFGLNYGDDPDTTGSGGRVWAVGPIERSAQQLSAFVQRVRAVTGAAQVDLVGWSQGGMMPRWYMRFEGGAPWIHELVGLAASNHGTNFNRLSSLLVAGAAHGLPTPLTVTGCPACDEQLVGSAFLGALNAGGDIVAGVHYVVIETTHDEVVTPYTSAFLAGPGVENITLQAQCPADPVEHLGLPYDSAAIADVINALGPDTPSFQPACGASVPVFGSPAP